MAEEIFEPEVEVEVTEVPVIAEKTSWIPSAETVGRNVVSGVITSFATVALVQGSQWMAHKVGEAVSSIRQHRAEKKAEKIASQEATNEEN